jgi:5'-nucleotidase
VADSINEITINSCNNPTGALPPIVDRMDDAIDVVVTGHTNWAVNCKIDGKIVTGAAHQGRLITDIDLTLSRATKDVVSATVNNTIVTRTVPKAPALTTLVDKYRSLSAPLANRIIGQVTSTITRTNNAAGESALGDVIADAQLYATTPASLGGAQIGFMNPGGIRADITFPSSPAGEGDGNVTYGEAFTVQPFGNSLVTMTLTGAQIETLLEQQFNRNAIMQVSAGFAYTWDATAPLGSRVDPASITLQGVPIDPAVNYRVTVNNFMADGGDGYLVLKEGTNRLGGDVDLDALEKYFIAQGVVAPGPQNRITRIG